MLNQTFMGGSFCHVALLKKVKHPAQNKKRCILMVCIAEISKATMEIGKIMLAAWITVKHVHKWRNYAVHKKYKVLKQLLCFWQGAVFGWIKAWIS